MISGFHCETDENCALLGYYQYLFITVQKSAVYMTEFVCVGRTHSYFNQAKIPIIFVSVTKLKTADTKM